MVKKQSAQKSSGKQARTPQKEKKAMHAGSSSSKKGKAKESSIRTDDNVHLWNMHLLPERGYDLKKASPSFMSTVANLNWDHFVLPRGGYIEDLVREFYAGITPQEGAEHSYTSMVRGKLVHFHAKKLNEHYMLKYNGNDFENRVANAFKKEMEEIRNKIAIPGAVWEKFTPNEIKLRSNYLINALGNWHLFIANSILPTSHTYAMTKERLILLDTILSEGHVDIGRLIAREILACSNKSKGFLFFPCLITELCMKEGVPIAANEQRKFPPGNLSAEVKEKLRNVRGPAPAMQEHYMQKQRAVWKFQNDQHDWLQLVFDKIFDLVGQVNAPEFPTWVLRSEGEEEEEKEVEEEGKGKEKVEEPSTKKKVTRKQYKVQKKVVVEPVVEELYDSESEAEDEELKEMDKELEEEEEEESDEEIDEEEEEQARGVILEEIARQKYAKTSASTQQPETPITSPATKTPIISPNQESSSIPKSPLPSLNDPPVLSQSPPQTTPPPPSPRKETQETTHTEQPTPVMPTDQAVPSDPSNIISNVVSALEKEIVQEREEEGLNKEDKEEESSAKETVTQTVEMQSDAPASLAAASQQATTVHDEATIKMVLEQMAQQKRDALHNTQKFFKQPAGRQAKLTPKRKKSDAVKTDAPASVSESIPATTPEVGGASAPTEATPSKPKEKKQKVKHTPPSRQSTRIRSGAKK